MDSVLLLLTLLAVVKTVLSDSLLPRRWQGLSFGLLCAAFVWLSHPWALELNKLQVENALSEQKALMNISLAVMLDLLLTFGMETTFFRFSNKEGEDARRVYSTTLLAVLGVGVCFLAVIFGFLNEIAAFLHYSDPPEYLGMMAACVAIDAFQSIPFAYLRLQKRALKFAALKLLFIFLNISLNLLYYVVLGKSDVFYAFAINLFCTALITVFFYPELRCVRWTLDWPLLRRMLRYAWPILILGIAGILNQTADKLI